MTRSSTAKASALIEIPIIIVVRRLLGSLLDSEQHARQRRLRASRWIQRQRDDAPPLENVLVNAVDVALEPGPQRRDDDVGR
jgi:hypothetical protein